MRAILAVMIGLAMVGLGYHERGYWAFGGEAIIELVCMVYLITWIAERMRGGKRV